jgi:hypothetical protein
MVAIPRLDLIVTGVWIGALTGVLVGQAVFAWLAFRKAERWAQRSGRLAEAIRTSPLQLPPATVHFAPEQPLDLDETPAPPRRTVEV